MAYRFQPIDYYSHIVAIDILVFLYHHWYLRFWMSELTGMIIFYFFFNRSNKHTSHKNMVLVKNKTKTTKLQKLIAFILILVIKKQKKASH